jgi:ABC-2 type transport system permease protein
MHELLLILNLKARSFLKTALATTWQGIFKNLSSIVIFGGFAVGVFFISRSVTLYMLQEAHIGQFLFHRFLSMLLYVFFITVNLGNMIVSYATLYRSQEVSFLMAMPVTHAKIFLIKFVDNFFYSSTTLSLVGFALLLGYGSCFAFPWYHYLITIFLVLLPFMLIAGIVAVLVLMMLIKVASRIGIRWLLGIIVTLYLSAIYTYFRITNPVELVNEVMKHYPDVNEYFGYLDPPFVHYLPNHWVTEYFYWSINGDPARAAANVSLLFFTMLGLIVFAGLVGRRYYYQSWLAASDAQMMQGPNPRPLRLKLLEFGRSTFLRPQTDVIVRRDLWLFLREPSQWLHLLMMFVLLLIFLVSIGSMEIKMGQPFLMTVTFLVIFLFNGFLLASMSLRFIFPSVSLEGEAFWVIRTSPYPLKRLYWQKFTSTFLALLVIAELLIVLSVGMLHGEPQLMLLFALATGFVVLALTALNLGAGTYFAAFKEKNPIRVASSQGASVTFLVSMIYMTIVALFLIFPLNRYFEHLMRYGDVGGEWVIFPAVGIGSLSLVVLIASTGLGLKSFQRDH